jgi:hypothetical protein
MMKKLLALAAVLGTLSSAFAFDESKGFKGRIRSIDPKRQAMILEAQIEGYGEGTSVSVRPKSVQDEDGGAVPFSELHKGTEVFVEYQGGFLESLPLQLMGQPPVTVLSPKIEGKISSIEERDDLGESWIYVGEGMESMLCRVSPSTKMPSRKLKVGDEVVVRYDGMVMESMPPQINAQAIKLKSAGAASKPGFDAKVLEARVFNGKLALVVESDLPGYGTTMVSVDVKQLVDEKGQDLPPSAVKAGSQVFVEHDGGFLESYPLQLGKATKVVVKGASGSAARAPGFEARIESADVQGGKLELMVAGNIAGYGNGTRVMFTAKELVDEAGNKLPLTAAKPGSKLFVEYSGGFLESLPLQLMSEPRCILLK